MVTRFGLILAAVFTAILIVLPAGAAAPAHNQNANTTITASANPSVVGQAVTFTVTGVSTQANVVTTFAVVNLATSETTGYTITGPVGTVAHTFAEAGEYFINVFQQRNGKQVLNLAYGSQTVE